MVNIIGAGGMGNELKEYMKDNGMENIHMVVEDNYCKDEIPLSKVDINGNFIIAIGNPTVRMRISQNEFRFVKFISNRVFIGNECVIGDGCIIAPYSVLSYNIQLGKHCIVNMNCTIGHNCRIGNFVTISPGVNISGDVRIGNNVFIGTNAAIKEKVTICDNVYIGMGTIVIKDIIKPGKYFGNPAKKIE